MDNTDAQQEYNAAMAEIDTRAAEMDQCLATILEKVARLNVLGKEVKAHHEIHKAHWKHYNQAKINDIFDRSKNIDQYLYELKKL